MVLALDTMEGNNSIHLFWQNRIWLLQKFIQEINAQKVFHELTQQTR